MNRIKILCLMPFAALCACSHAPQSSMPAAFEARWLQPLLSPESMTAPREQVVEFDLGKFLVIETNDVYLPAGYVSFLLDGETIVAATEEKKAYLEAFLKAA